MKNDLRVSMPEEIMLRMAQADTPDAARREGILIAQEMLEAVRPIRPGRAGQRSLRPLHRRRRGHRQRAAAGHRLITGRITSA